MDRLLSFMHWQANPCEPALNVIECNEFCKSGQSLVSVAGTTTCPSCALKAWGSTEASNYGGTDC